MSVRPRFRAARLAVAAALAPCLLAGGLGIAVAVPAAASVAAPSVAVASAAAAPTPAGFVTLVDDTGALTMAVPAAWTDVDTTPGTNDDGTPMPWISASTDFAAYRSGFDVPGAIFIGVTYTTDLQSWVDRLSEAEACGSHVVDPYDDGSFRGLDVTDSQCGTSAQATLRTIVANPTGDTSRTYVLQIQSPTAADLADVDPILASLDVAGPGVAPTANAPTGDAPTAAPSEGPATLPAGTTPIVPVTLPDGSTLGPVLPPGAGGATTTTVAGPSVFTPTNAVVPGAIQVIDDTRTISVAVPPDWNQSATTPTTGDPAGALPQIVAGPDLASFTAGAYAVPGVRYVARPFTADTSAAVSAAAAGLPCTPGPVQEYADPVFTGHVIQLTDCGGAATRIYLVMASPASQTMTASLLVQVTDFDDSDLQTILSTFNVDPTAPAPGTATTVAPTTAPPPVTVAATVPGPTLAPATTAAGTTVPIATAPIAPVTTAAPGATTGPGATTVPATTVVSSEVFTPPVAFPDDTVALVDDTGLLRVGVPPAWSDVDTASVTWNDGTQVPYIAASPDLSQFLHDPAAGPDPFVVPGVVYLGLPYTADTAAVIPTLIESEACTPGVQQVYQDSVFTGHVQQFTGCGGTQTRLFVVVASPADQKFTAALIIQVIDDPTPLNTVLATFNYVATAPAPGTAPISGATTTTTTTLG